MAVRGTVLAPLAQLALLVLLAPPTLGSAAPAALCSSVDECLKTPLWHLPGPNPIISPWRPGGKPSWMSFECEVAGGVERLNTTHWVFIYHCLNDKGYQVGMSTATHPLGPWTKPPTRPNLPIAAGEWDGTTVACFNIMPDPKKPGHWLGFYAASGEPTFPAPIGLGIARAASPLGPWTKSPRNPVLAGGNTTDHAHCFEGDQRCGGLYVAAVMYGPQTNFSYWVYMSAPINQNDEGAIALWKAEEPEGPYSFVAYVLDGALRNDGGGEAAVADADGVDVSACEAQCMKDGHCCVGFVSSYGKPSCANGCALAGAGARDFDACAAACASAASAGCVFTYRNISLDMCQNCPPGCDATAPSECADGCRIAFGKPAPAPPLPCSRGGPCWDSGRYSESKVVYYNGLFHLFATASAVGGNASTANKIVEQVGWAVSDDGVHFREYPHNPVGPQLSGQTPGPTGQHWATTPLTGAMAEGHAVLNGSLVYVFHTIRWAGDGEHAFCPEPRNGEDLGVEIFTASPEFEVEFPIITPNWALALSPGEASPCQYDKANYRFCASLKTKMHSSATTRVLKPSISFRVEGTAADDVQSHDDDARVRGVVNASVVVSEFFDYGAVGKVLVSLPLVGKVSAGGRYAGVTRAITADELPRSVNFIVATVSNALDSVPLRAVTQVASYSNSNEESEL